MTAHGDSPDSRGEVREDGVVPLRMHGYGNYLKRKPPAQPGKEYFAWLQR
jgi:hypothetical protein